LLEHSDKYLLQGAPEPGAVLTVRAARKFIESIVAKYSQAGLPPPNSVSPEIDLDNSHGLVTLTIQITE
jgi:hypothetical protein